MPAEFRPAEFRIVRLQIQTGPMKVGRAPLRQYRTDGLQQVERLLIDDRGSHGVWTADDGHEQRAIDVHHRDHPQSRNRKGGAGLSVFGTGDYDALRERYGPHLVDGAVGESVLVDAPAGLADLDFPTTFAIRGAAGMIAFVQARVADPCVEFSRFCLGEQPSPQVSDAVRQALIDLDDGHRGYRAAAAAAGTITVGDRLVLGPS
ncbi:hypothetical protein [Microlunatus soli]|uniref:MOSC domain-containing protein n=1 Tax=Microlunatus soli TaxID=630515 RepID=A0A1H1TAC5_9ACTN|nr:hypothetical protein [Microlunatus soli]SDS56976.1 hypothetical protein SAMN04489812_2311 [Microlunatus soli]